MSRLSMGMMEITSNTPPMSSLLCKLAEQDTEYFSLVVETTTIVEEKETFKVQETIKHYATLGSLAAVGIANIASLTYENTIKRDELTKNKDTNLQNKLNNIYGKCLLRLRPQIIQKILINCTQNASARHGQSFIPIRSGSLDQKRHK
mmetsp:Transcript_19715/g.22545  ORF Transcript_19715/g.22545 Transcript_19715/m.22545 type:complete len:148 (-) Transcript_19715:115-558(-)